MELRRGSQLLAALVLSAAAQAQPVRVILVGDSTLATRSGYGDALCQRFRPDVACINLARGGRSSGSFRAEGLWDRVQDLLREGSGYRASYVLIQFGHNDQPGKPGRSTDLATEFPVNMARYVTEVKALGGVPVLLTPLTRRSFKGQVLQNDLRPWAEASIRVAASELAPLLDLNALSYAAVQAMGEDEADTLAMAEKPAVGVPALPSSQSERAGAANPIFDRTHLGDKGARVFSTLVAQELVRLQPDLKNYLKAEPKQ
ncbi:MAG: rhamnogalacturonan acetylesterase [Burkholderiaceae bacterium]|nr:rhamnogalacturonan acetylesterase [Burkholderiaceae bacterium]